MHEPMAKGALMRRASYPSNVTDAEWQILGHDLSPPGCISACPVGYLHGTRFIDSTFPARLPRRTHPLPSRLHGGVLRAPAPAGMPPIMSYRLAVLSQS